MKVAQYVKVPSKRFGAGSVHTSLDTFNPIQIYKTSQWEMQRHYNTKEEEAMLHEKHQTETVQFDNEF